MSAQPKSEAPTHGALPELTLPTVAEPVASVNYSYDRDLDEVVVKFLSQNKTVIRQVPPEEAIKLYKAIDKLIRDNKSKERA